MIKANKILILFAHPAFHKSRTNSTLLRHIQDIEGVKIHHLYNAYPDFHIDVQHEQQLLIDHDIIIWHHPFYWYSAPAIVKEWIDLVLQHNFAYGRKGNALVGKKMFNVLTAGGQRERYQQDGPNAYSINQLLAPFERTVKLCKMEYYPPFVVHGTHLLGEADISKHGEDYKKLLISLRDNLFDEEEILKNEYLNDLIKISNA